jgi:hypothetical protein
MRYNSFKHWPRYFQAFTGLKVEEFDRLIAQSRSDWINQRIEKLNRNNPNRKRKIGAGRKLRKIIPDIDEFLADATEQKIPRPEKKLKRKKYHSGKKKAFTIKTQIAINRQGFILYTSRASPGRIHDYKLFKESSLPKILPQGAKLYLDSGYQGIQKDFPYLDSIIPFKRTKNHQKLTRSEKIRNTKQRKIRVKVEHSLSHLKKFNVLSY